MFKSLTKAQAVLEHKDFKRIHGKAVEAVKELKSKEAQLIRALQDVDDNKVYRRLGYNSIYQYCLALGLSESQSANYISVSRKARKLPRLQEAIDSGEISISKARTLNSVINERNQEKWIEVAIQVPQRKLQKEVAKVNPRELIPESAKYVNDTLLNLQVPLAEDTYQKIERVREILRSKEKRSVTIEQSLEAMAEAFLEKHDPLRKAKRAQTRQVQKAHLKYLNSSEKKPNKHERAEAPDAGAPVALQVNRKKSRAIPAHVKHKVVLRDQGRCRFHLHGRRCESRTFLDLHHMKPISEGGAHEVSNLVTLCSQHHKVVHGPTRKFSETLVR